MNGEAADPLAQDISFELDGERWIARSGGTGAGGAGARGLAPFEAVHFYRPGEARPRFEALTARGRLEQLFEAELAELLRRATAVPPAS